MNLETIKKTNEFTFVGLNDINELCKSITYFLIVLKDCEPGVNDVNLQSKLLKISFNVEANGFNANIVLFN